MRAEEGFLYGVAAGVALFFWLGRPVTKQIPAPPNDGLLDGKVDYSKVEHEHPADTTCAEAGPSGHPPRLPKFDTTWWNEQLTKAARNED